MQHHQLKLDRNKANLTVEGQRLDNLPVPSMPWHSCSNLCFFLLNINYRQIKLTQPILNNTKLQGLLLDYFLEFENVSCWDCSANSTQTNHSKWLDSSCDSTLTRWSHDTTLTWLKNNFYLTSLWLDWLECLWLWDDSESTNMTQSHRWQWKRDSSQWVTRLKSQFLVTRNWFESR